MGQSNAAEQCTVTDLTGGDVVYGTAYSGGRYTRKVFSDESDTTPSVRDWQDYTALSGRIGLENAFARTMGAGHHLAKWAVGGSDLQWWTDNAKFLEAANWVLSQKARLPFQAYVAGVIFVQGESGPTSGWQALAEAGFAVLRTAFANATLPIIIVQTHISLGGAAVHDAQEALDAADANVYLVNTDAYPLDPSPHWNVEICRIGEDVAAIVAAL